MDVLTDDEKFEAYNSEMAKLYIDVSNHTSSVLTIYYRYNIELMGPTAGFWYGYEDGTLKERPTTNLSLYDKYDIQNSAWYHIPYEKKQACWIEPFFDQSINSYVISYAVPVYYNNTFIGVIGMEIDFAVITDMVKQVDAFDGGQAYILNKYNKVVYHETLSYNSNKPALEKGCIEVKNQLNNEMIFVISAPIQKIVREGNVSLVKVIIYFSVFLAAELVLMYFFISKTII